MTTLDSGPASAIQNSVPALSGSRVRLEGPISEPWMEDIGYADTSAGKMESATQRDRRPQGSSPRVHAGESVKGVKLPTLDLIKGALSHLAVGRGSKLLEDGERLFQPVGCILRAVAAG